MKKESLGEKDDDYREKQTEKGLARRAAGRTVRAGLDQPEHSPLTDAARMGGICTRC